MAEIFNFDPVDANNTGRWPEGTMKYRDVNDAGRADEGLLARWYKDGNTTIAATGAGNAFAVTSSRTITSLVDGLVQTFKANHSITGAATLNLNALGAKAIRLAGGTALSTGDILNGQRVEVVYDAANDWWQLLSDRGASASIVDLTVTEAVVFSGDVSPAQITSNQNNYDPPGLADAFTLRLSSDASRNITGQAGGVAGRILRYDNVGSNPIVLTNDDAASSAANRYLFGGNATLAAGRSFAIKYDGTSSRWRAYESEAVDGSLTPVKLSTSTPAAPQAPVNLGLTNTVAAGALTILLRTEDDNNPSASSPVLIPFRNSAVGSSLITWRAVASSLSLVLSSGSTLGAVDNVAFKVWIVAFNDAGTVRLGAIKCLSGSSIFPLGQLPVASSTAEGGAGGADSAHVFYTGTAVASKAYTILGYFTWESGLVTAGTWADPTRRHVHFPGQPLPGAIIQSAMNFVTATATGTTTVPRDDTIPQNTEGTEFLTQAITPTSAANLLDINYKGLFSSSSTITITHALFQDAVASALAAMAIETNASNLFTASLFFRALAALTSSTTFKIRAGPDAANTVRINGISSARVYGGVAASYLKVEELMA